MPCLALHFLELGLFVLAVQQQICSSWNCRGPGTLRALMIPSLLHPVVANMNGTFQLTGQQLPSAGVTRPSVTHCAGKSATASHRVRYLYRSPGILDEVLEMTNSKSTPNLATQQHRVHSAYSTAPAAVSFCLASVSYCMPRSGECH